MSEILDNAIKAVNESRQSMAHFIVANETGATGSHQAGFLVPHRMWPMFFDTPGRKGENKDRFIRIHWQNDLITDSRVVYYGTGTRNEYRLTRFGKGFPFLQEDCAGDLLVLSKVDEDNYQGFVLASDDDIDGFLAQYDISPADLNKLIEIQPTAPDDVLLADIAKVVGSVDFPTTAEMSKIARELYRKAYRITDRMVRNDPDKTLLAWIDTEYSLFKAFENKEFAQRGLAGITDCQTLIDYANSLTNRRKARAGKSLEHHLSSVFDVEGIRYEAQVVTEGNKRPDFIFPDGKSYHNLLFPGDGLTFLGAKTTCKDRWRQVLNEADRIPHKFLFTLQQGISSNQLKEMESENLSLVVPKSYICTFDKRYHHNIFSLEAFVSLVRRQQSKFYPL